MLSNTAVPKYYGAFRDAVLRGEIPVNQYVEMEMNRIDDLIANPGIYYDDRAVEGYIDFCESELTLTDGEDLHLLDTFKLWAEQVFGWYYFVEKDVFVPNEDGIGGHMVTKRQKKRLIKKRKRCASITAHNRSRVKIVFAPFIINQVCFVLVSRNTN